ncbi:MAG: hypothetical protein WB779_12725 [Ignavibacteriaceae bacterium]|jgi:hypothetical protein
MKNKLEGVFAIILLGTMLLTQTFDIKLLVVSILLSAFTFLQFARG